MKCSSHGTLLSVASRNGKKIGRAAGAVNRDTPKRGTGV
jgi:hypothetical protein